MIGGFPSLTATPTTLADGGTEKRSGLGIIMPDMRKIGRAAVTYSNVYTVPHRKKFGFLFGY
jgi:hypothetical protein